jgi:hypothetical protein
MTQPSRPAQAGQPVRWKYRGRWRHGHLGDPPVERDGSLRVFDDYNGAARALRSMHVQARGHGPRGGVRWTPVVLPRDVAGPGDGGAGREVVRRGAKPTNLAAESGGLGL